MSKPQPILGNFHITHMDEWDQDFVDAEVPGYVRFDRHGRGKFQFGYVTGQMDCKQTERDGRPAVEWTFEGNDEMDPITGRGWAVLQGDGTLEGMLFIHTGGSSGFTAQIMPEKKTKPKASKKPIRKVQVINAETGQLMMIDADKLKPGTLRHETLADPLLRRIKAIHRAVKGAYDLPLEQMEVNFMRDLHPERAVAFWEKLVVALGTVAAAMPKLDRKMILMTLLAYSMGALSPAERADPVVMKIIGIVEGK
jgi:hypothetical protein